MSEGTQCPECERYRSLGECDAFPEGIPQDIFNGVISHDKPYPNDNDLQFKKASNT